MKLELILAQAAQSPQGDWLGIAIGCSLLFGGLGIKILVSWIAWRCAKSIPEQHREVAPWVAWLLLIPGLSLFLNFVVFPGISKGFQKVFPTKVAGKANDCGYQYGMWYSIAVALSVLPGVICFTILIAPILLAFTLLELSDCRKQTLKLQKLRLGAKKPTLPSPETSAGEVEATGPIA